MGVKMIIISYENHTLKEDHMRQGGPVTGVNLPHKRSRIYQNQGDGLLHKK